MREQSLFDLLKMILMKILDELSKRKKTPVSAQGNHSRPIFLKI